MYILGLSSYAHEAACALIRDGELRWVIEEERLNREKHTWKYPARAIAECLAREGISIHDVDCVTFFWRPLREVTGNLGHVLRYFPRSLNLLRAPSGGGEAATFGRIRRMQGIGGDVARQFGLKRRLPVHFVEHHLAHAASAFFVSPFEDAAILTVDGRGESTSTMMSRGRGIRIEKLEEIAVPHSLGHVYAAVTAHLWFQPFFDEWKVMAMSAYGGDGEVAAFARLVELSADGLYRVNLDYFSFHTHGADRWVSPLFERTFGPRRRPDEPYGQRHFDIARALQRTVERAGVHLANALHERTGSENLCMAGGVVLNCLMNRKIVEETPFKRFFFQPVANDAGASFGSALYHYHQELSRPDRHVFESPYLGMGYGDEEIDAVLRKRGVRSTRSNDIARVAAAHVAQGAIVGWFQGRMEAGPRALGHRSIVADPTDPAMKERLNARVKRRETFRPFAPSVLEERVGDYFVMPRAQMSPYMILVGDVRPDRRPLLPAITHRDGTARVHTVSQSVTPRFWRLISEFEKIKGVPVVLNTSFNENEPIVGTPEHAVDCFLRTELDVLAIGDFLCLKRG